MSQPTTKKRDPVLWSRRIHFIFMILFGLATIALIILPVAWINYTITFQSGLLYITLFSFGVITCSQPNKEGNILRSNRVIICVSLAVSIACIIICTINPVSILITECPKYSSGHHDHHDHHHHKKSPHYESIAPYTKNTLDVLVRYNVVEPGGEDEIVEHALSLKYNLTGKRVERREWSRGENSWRATATQFHAMTTDPVCSTDKYSRFLFLEAEIEDEIRDRREHLESMSSIRYSSPHNNGQTTPEEDQFDLNRWVRRICKNEVGFTIAYLVFMGLLILLEVVALFWYAFQKSK